MGKMKRMLALFVAFSLAAGSIFEAEVKTAKAETETEIPVTKSGEIDDEVSFEYTFKIQSEWEKHYNAEMTLKNTADNKMENWEVAFEYDGENGKVKKESLYQFTVYPYDEEDELDEDDCIWEGDEEEDDPMSVVDDEIFDEDDYDRMNEDELAVEEGLFRIFWYIYLRLVYQFCFQ